MRQVRKAPQNQQHVVTYTVVLSTSNLDGALLPGMTALVKIVIEQQDDREGAAGRTTFPAFGAPPDPTAPHAAAFGCAPAAARFSAFVTVGAAGTEQVALKSGELVEGSQVAVGQAIRPAGMEFLGIRFGS